ncbi:MAG: TonB-dependent hemoglobin/transferrin/lactoferrin family receptor [Burkholderiaceae bacterium]|nr:MAG: TonB-dependent hemoglobin/transferrin/lactoferrin family receptor [Burkholderiaceae bacterium]
MLVTRQVLHNSNQLPLSSKSRKPITLKPITRALQSAFVLATICLAPAIQAQNKQNDAASIDHKQTVVISATRYETLLENVPLSIDVIGREELDRNGVADIRDIARNLANIEVKRAPARFTITGVGNATGRDANAGFSIRGQDGNRVLMVIDGVRLPRSYVNGSNAFGRDSLAMDLVKQVEITRGPASVLYGSDGLAGLVNFITMNPDDVLRQASPRKDGAQQDYAGTLGLSWNGDDHSRVLNGTMAGRINPEWTWLLTANTTQGSELRNQGSNNVANIDRTTPNPESYHSQAALFKLAYRPNSLQQHSLTAEWVHKTSEIELLSSRAKLPLTSASAVTGEHANKDFQRQRLQWTSRYQLVDSVVDHIQTNLSFQDSDAQDNGVTHRNTLADRVRLVSYQERGWQANLMVDKLIKHDAQWAQRWSMGFDYANLKVSNFFNGVDPSNADFVPRKYFPDTRDSSKAVFLQDEIFAGKWIITPGIRFDHFDLDVLTQAGFAPPAKTPAKSLSGSATVPKLGMVYKLDRDWNLYVNGAGGFRAPNAQQINGVFDSSTVPAVLLSNPDLRPEKSRNIEVGLRAFYDFINFDLAAFRGQYRDLIYDKKPLGGKGVAGDPAIFQTVNIDKAIIKGYELRGTAQWGRIAAFEISSPFAVGHTQGWDETTHLPLNSINPNKVVMGLRVKSADLDLQLNARHLSAKTEADMNSPYLSKPATPPRIKQFAVPAANVLDMQLSYRVNAQLLARVSIENLGNKKYWNWADVQGLAANSVVVDAYTQSGRAAHASLNWRF